jgi:hypothetical protein
VNRTGEILVAARSGAADRVSTCDDAIKNFDDSKMYFLFKLPQLPIATPSHAHCGLIGTDTISRVPVARPAERKICRAT